MTALVRDREVRTLLVVDAANVIGSRPTGWWRDRPGAARAFTAQLRAAVRSGALADAMIVVLEGQSRRGADEGTTDGVEVVHAPGEGDDTIAAVAAEHCGCTVVTADRALADRARAVGADVVGPTWLLERLDDTDDTPR
ncbi:MAG: hypothetical protein KDB36_05215 [Acidimicrobiales bacterium]|nr:hypothetical protein [Acidimicrobiales bacterium]